MSDFLNGLASDQADEEARSNAPKTSDKFQPMPPSGWVNLAILPPLESPFGNGKLFRPSIKHFTKNNGVLTCPAPRKGPFAEPGYCLFDDHASELFRAATKAERRGDQAEADRLRAQARAVKGVERYSFNVWTKEHGNRILTVGKVVRDIILKRMVGDPKIGEAGLGDCTLPEQSRPFKLVKIMDSGYPSYTSSRWSASVVPLPPDQVAAILAGRFDLRQENIPSTAEELQAAFRAEVGAGASASPSPSTSNTKPAATSTTVGGFSEFAGDQAVAGGTVIDDAEKMAELIRKLTP